MPFVNNGTLRLNGKVYKKGDEVKDSDLAANTPEGKKQKQDLEKAGVLVAKKPE